MVSRRVELLRWPLLQDSQIHVPINVMPNYYWRVGEGQGKLSLEVFFYNQESIIMDSWYNRVSRYIVAHYVYWNNSLFSNASLRHCFSYKGRYVHS